MVEEEDRETILIPEKRTRHDSNSTDVDPGFEVEPLSSETPVRRDSFSPCGSGGAVAGAAAGHHPTSKDGHGCRGRTHGR